MSIIGLPTKIVRVTPGVFSRYVSNDGAQFVTAGDKKLPEIVPSADSVEAILRFTIVNLKLSKNCFKYLKNTYGQHIRMQINWQFSKFDDEVLSPGHLNDSDKSNTIEFDFTNKYTLDINIGFLDCVSKDPIKFQLYAVVAKQSHLVGRGTHLIGDINAMNNLKKDARVWIQNPEIDKGYIATVYISYRFSCHHNLLNSLYMQKQSRQPSLTPSLTKKILQAKSLTNVGITSSEVRNFQDGLFLVLNRNKALKTTQSEISIELKDRADWLKYEANWKQTLQENAILHGKDPTQIVWRQWREADTAKIKLREYSEKQQHYKSVLEITVKTLSFYYGSAPMTDNSVQQVYVEYSFLNKSGPEMETPLSLRKPTNPDDILRFNFTKSFSIDLEKDYEDCKILANMIRNEESIRFVFISEPLEDPNKPIQVCKEIGYVNVNLADVVQCQENNASFRYEVLGIKPPNSPVGLFVCKFQGILAMRRMALQFLAPRNYNVYM